MTPSQHNWILWAQALVSQRAAAELQRRRDAKAEAKKIADAQAQAKRDADELDDLRRMNYNRPINFLAGTMEVPDPYPELSVQDWNAKKADWVIDGNFDAMYASTDPDRYGRLGKFGRMAGQPYAVVEAEVRRLCMTP